MQEPVEASGSSGSRWEAVEDREGVRRGAGGAGDPEEVRKAVGKCGRGGKTWEVMVRYRFSPL